MGGAVPPICVRGVHRSGFMLLPLQSTVSLCFVLGLLNDLWEFLLPVKILDSRVPHPWCMCITLQSPATAVVNTRGCTYKSRKITHTLYS
jgi:hypothetical protein